MRVIIISLWNCIPMPYGKWYRYWKAKHRLGTTCQYTGVPITCKRKVKPESTQAWLLQNLTAETTRKARRLYHAWSYKRASLKKKGEIWTEQQHCNKAACTFTSCLCLLAATTPRKKATLPVACCHLLRKDQGEAQKAFSVPLEGESTRRCANAHTLMLKGKLPTTALENAVTWLHTGQGRKSQIRPSRSLILSNPLTSLWLLIPRFLSHTAPCSLDGMYNGCQDLSFFCNCIHTHAHSNSV